MLYIYYIIYLIIIALLSCYIYYIIYLIIIALLSWFKLCKTLQAPNETIECQYVNDFTVMTNILTDHQMSCEKYTSDNEISPIDLEVNYYNYCYCIIICY